MDLMQGEPGSSTELCVTSTLDENEVVGIEAERVSDGSEVADQETTIPAIKIEPNISCVPLIQVASALPSYKRRKDVQSEPSVIASQPRSLNDLPEEILLCIFSHLGPEDLCLIIAKVCEQWRFLAKDVVLWKKLAYVCDVSSDIIHIKEVLTNAPALHSLVIREREDAADILKFLFHKHGDLRKLSLDNCSLGEDATGLVANIVDLYPHLEGLSLIWCESLTSAVCSIIPRLKKLSELNLAFCEGLPGETVRFIADSCQHLKKLGLLAVVHETYEYEKYYADYYDDDVIHVIKKLGKQLTTLYLDGFALTDVAYLYLNNCARLQELQVHHCLDLTDRGLLEGIGSLHELTSLHLTEGCGLTAEAFSTFLHQPSMSSIVLLNLSYCRYLDDEGLKGIAERCIHLKELAVCFCVKVTDAGISIVIIQCSRLRVLNLRDLVSITGNGWMALVPSHVPHLRELCLELCHNVFDKYVEELKAALPELIVTK